MRRIQVSLSYRLLLWLMPLVLFAPLLLQGQVLFWGTVSLQFLPWRMQSIVILRQGQLPLWNPLVGMGAPLLANYQSALFYPPNWFVLLLGALGGIGWAAWGQTVVVVFHLIWAGFGMAELTRRLGQSSLAQVVAGLGFGLCGYLVSRSGFLSINAAVSWLPWVMMETTELGQKGFSWRTFIRLTLILALQFLCGHAQTVWYTIILAMGWVGYFGWNSRLGLSTNKFRGIGEGSLRLKINGLLRAWWGFGLAVIAAVALTAIQLLPTAELLINSQRSNAVKYEYAVTYSFWPWRLLTLLAPNMFGSPVSGDYWGYGAYWEDALYIGVLPIISALLTLGSVVKRDIGHRYRQNGPYNYERLSTPPGFVYFLLVWIVVSFVLALGKNTPIFPWLYYHVPSFSLFQAPTRFSIWAEFALVMLASVGVSSWHRPKGKALYWTRLATAGAVATSLACGLAWLYLGNVSPTFIRGIAIFGLLGAGCGVLSLIAPRRNEDAGNTPRSTHLWGWAVALLVGIDLVWMGWGLNPGIGMETLARPASTAEEVRRLSDGGRLFLMAEDEYELKFKRFMRFDRYSIAEPWGNLRAVLLPNLNVLDGIPSANNFDPLLPARYARFMEKLGEIGYGRQSANMQRLLALMGVGVLEEVVDEDDHRVSFTSLPNPKRLHWVTCAYAAKDEEGAWDLIFDQGIDLERGAVIEGAQTNGCSSYDPGAPQTTIQWLRDSPNRLEVRVNATQPGWLVLADIWYPGWRASVDGSPVPVARANYLFRGIAMPPGEHVVRFEYIPWSFWTGAVISLVSGAAMMTFTLVRRKHWQTRV